LHIETSEVADSPPEFGLQDVNIPPEEKKEMAGEEERHEYIR
jgi:hypothetical protein